MFTLYYYFIKGKKYMLYSRFSLILLFISITLTLLPQDIIGHSEDIKKIEFSDAIIVTAGLLSGPAQKSVTLLVEEIFDRTGIKLSVKNEWPEGTQSVIVIGTFSDRKKILADNNRSKINLTEPGREGFQLWTTADIQNVCYILGADDRGILYGVGKLLRSLHFSSGKMWLTGNIKVSETPAYSIRGHQLGYRNLNNTYDAWNVKQYEKYIRELALFGANSIEYVAPYSKNYKQNRLMTISPDDMLQANSQICKNYGMDVWLWYPVGKEVLLSLNLTKQELQQREKIFKLLPKLDAVFVPGAEHHDLPLERLFPFLEKMAQSLKKHHSNSKIWVSLQNSHAKNEWLDLFFEKLNKKPDWLGGVVFAPWTSISIQEVRRRLASEIPIRRYPDIAHNRNCEYPIPAWDPAFQLTQARESTNPRPVAIKQIHNATDEFAIGGIGYSDGINDDVNKFIWLAQEWNPDTDVMTTLREYARLFVGENIYEGVAQGILAEERNWHGPLISNTQIPITLKQWQQMGRMADPKILANYRFQMGLIRAYYDSYLQQRLVYETNLQYQAETILSKATNSDVINTINSAESIFQKAVREPIANGLRQRCLDLADSLHRSIGAQLTVEKHGASAVNRGAYISTIDVPLNDVFWYTWNFREIKKMNTGEKQLEALETLLNRTNPGPGGFYQNCGDYAEWMKIVTEESWAADPGTFTIPRVNFGTGLPEDRTLTWEGKTGSGYPLAWYTLATGLYESPFQMTFDNLDSQATYMIRVIYSGQFRSKIKLIADKKYVIHPIIDTEKQSVFEYEFDIPKLATEKGFVSLEWQSPDGERGAQVAEVWLIPKK